MARRYLTISDLTGKPIDDDGDVVTVVVWDHPLIEEPVKLDAGSKEVAQLEGSTKDYAVIELISDGGDKSERLVLEISEFDKLFTQDADDVLKDAEKYSYGKPSTPAQDEPKRRGRPPGSGSAAAKPAGEKTDYTAPENYGRLHRGRTTEAEQQLVRDNLEQANANRRAAGQSEIDLSNPKDVERYGLQEVAKKQGVSLNPEFKA